MKKPRHEDIPVVLLCGGEGTRIRGVAEDLPKPLLPIGDKPILWHIMKGYAAHGFNNFILCLGYRGQEIKKFFLDYAAHLGDYRLTLGNPSSVEPLQPVEEFGWKITFAETGVSSMTGHRVWRVRQYLEGAEHFCVTYGDGVSDVNLTELVERHRESGLTGTITTTLVPGRFGEVKQEKGIVTEFAEKPVVSEGRINGGFMVFDNKKVWDYFDANPQLVLEREPIGKMVLDGQLGAHHHKGYWQCMDTFREYLALNERWSNGKAPWSKSWKKS